MRRLAIGLVLVATTAIGGCGSASSFLEIRVRPAKMSAAVGKVAKDVARELALGVLDVTKRVVLAVLR